MSYYMPFGTPPFQQQMPNYYQQQYGGGSQNNFPMPMTMQPNQTDPALYPSMRIPQIYPPQPFQNSNMMQAQYAHGGHVSRNGLRSAAEQIRQAGEGRDKILAHINPEEAQYLNEVHGGGINPRTGLPTFGLGGPNSEMIRNLLKNSGFGSGRTIFGSNSGMTIFGLPKNRFKFNKQSIGIGGDKFLGIKKDKLKLKPEILLPILGGAVGLLAGPAGALAGASIGASAASLGKGSSKKIEPKSNPSELQNAINSGPKWGPEFNPRRVRPKYRQVQNVPQNYNPGHDPEMLYFDEVNPEIEYYAAGGQVHVFSGNAGGQDDNLPVRLPDKSYIVDSSSLSDFGDGNTSAGYQRLIQGLSSFKKNKNYKSGEKESGEKGRSFVKAMVSPGEAYISPEIVSLVGDGSIEKGAKKFKTFVSNLRKHKRSDPKNLPPKAKSLEYYMKSRRK